MKRNFVSAFFETVSRYPQAVALHERDRQTISYAALAQSVAANAARLSKVDGNVIALQIPRSAEFVVALIATWAARKTALIMDPDWPQERADQILRKVAPAKTIGRNDVELTDGGEREIPQVDLSPDEPAYVIFTSGSGGKPKGALLPFGGLCDVLDAQIEAFALEAGSRFCWLHGIAFDASISDLGTTLLSGATLCFDSEIDLTQLPQWWSAMSITHVDLPPALLPHISVESIPENLQTVVVGGQVCDPDAIRRWSNAVRVVNVYGPTEATICTSLSICDPGWQRALIGQPIPGFSYDVDAATGELSISGSGVALGYIGDPELSAERFSLRSDQRTFHTRDRVLLHPDGEIEFLGRLDRQLKVHGRLVHPEEIEAALVKFNSICEAFVFAREGTGHLVACIVPIAEVEIEIDTLATHLREHVPHWMIPVEWKILSTIPTGATGKPDPAKISEAFATNEATTVAFTPREAALSDIFSEALGGRKIGLDQHFHEAGGDSLATLRLITAAADKGIELSITAINSLQTIRRLGAAIDSDQPMPDSESSDKLRARIMPLVSDQPPVTRMHSDSLMHRVLITGATGFLGAAVLAELLERAPHLEFVCIVRGGSIDRVTAAMESHGSALPANTARLTCLDGDIAQPQFALLDDDWRQLSKNIDTVVHVAADVSLAKNCRDLWPSNVLGTKHVLDFTSSGRGKTLHFVSTLSVLVDAHPLPTACLESDTLSSTDLVFGGYAQSKWAAEILVRESCGADHVAIYRPGLLTANSCTGYSPEGDWFSRFLASHDFDAADCEQLTCDFTPVDQAAKEMAMIILQQVPGVYHISSGTPMSYAALRNLKPEHPPTSAAPFELSSVALAPSNSPLRIFKTTGTRISRERAAALLTDLE